MQQFIQRSPRIFFLLLITLLIGSILFALNVGKFPISPSQLWQTVVCSWDSQCNSDSPINTVLWQIRSPRIVVACLVGASLACAGATLSRHV